MGMENIYFGERICFRKTEKKSGIAFSLTEGAMPFRCKLWFILRKICILKCILELKNSLLRDMLFLYFLAEKRRCDMAASYKKLFHLLIEKNMTNAQLQQEAGFSANIITRLKRGGYISLESVESICRVLNCGVDDILEFIPEDNGGKENGLYQKGTGT